MLLILKDKKQTVAGAEKTINSLINKLRNKNIGADCASFDDLELFIEKNNVRAKICGKDIFDYNFIFFRRVGERRNTAYIISRIAAQNNIKCVDRLYSNTNAPGKLKQTTMLALGEVSVPKTYFAGEYSQDKINEAIEYLGLPIVAKNSRGQKGKGVFLAKDKNELEKIISDNKEEEEVFLQEFIQNSFDYRILVLGEKIACAEKRTRIKEGEFRNNVYLGAKEEFIEVANLDEKIKNIAVDAAKVADIQVAGVDVVQDDEGNTFVFEVNRAPAFTHDESISPELNLLTEYLIQCDKESQR